MDSAITFPAKIAGVPRMFSRITSDMCRNVIRAPGFDKAHIIWVFPVNGLVNLTAFILQPVISLIITIVGLVFAGIGLASEENSEDWSYSADLSFEASINGLKAMLTFFVRIGYPTYNNLEMRHYLLYGSETEQYEIS